MNFVRVTNREEMTECMEISQSLFGVGRETVDERMKILEKNPDSYHMLKYADEIIGYVAVMPLQVGQLKKVLRQTIPVKIDVEDIESLEGGKTIDLYLHAIGVKPGFTTSEKHLFGARLIAGLMDMVIGWGNLGISITTIAARSNMPDGIRLMKHAGFTEVEPLTPERRTFVINVKESGLPFILQYKKALKEAQLQSSESASKAIANIEKDVVS